MKRVIRIGFPNFYNKFHAVKNVRTFPINLTMKRVIRTEFPNSYTIFLVIYINIEAE